MDLMEPTQTKCVSGKTYIFVIVDDFSRYTRVAFLINKYDGFERFTFLFQKLTTEEHIEVTQIVKIKNDHGRKFKNTNVSRFCEEYGIFHEFSTPQTLEQKGVLKNISLQKMSRVTLNSKKLPLYYEHKL